MFTMPVILSLPTSAKLKFWKKRSVNLTDYDPTYKVVYIGNILTSYAKGDGCTEKPLQSLWKAYAGNRGRNQMPMEVTVCNSGIKAVTKAFGVTEYWAYRITYCCAPPEYPGLFCWIYRHERPKMKQELRCHAALCVKPELARELARTLKDRLQLALQEFRREKLTRQKARLSLANAVYDCPSMPRRKLLLYRGAINFRPPIEMSKIAPKLTVIDEDLEEDYYESAIPIPRSGSLEDYDDMSSYAGSSEDSGSLSSSPEEEEMFTRFRRLNSIGESSDEDLSSFCDDSGSNASDESC